MGSIKIKWRCVVALTLVLQLSTVINASIETSASGSTSSQNKIDGGFKYEPNANQIITLQVPGATSYEITFTNVKTEKDFDLITVHDGDNTLIQTISGELDEAVVVVVNHAEAEIKFTSDGTTESEGFDVSWKATVDGDGGGDGGISLQELRKEMAEVRKLVKSLTKTKGKQIFFDHGLVSDFHSRFFTTLQIERQYHTSNAWINLQREFICKDSGFYKIDLTGATGTTSPTVVRVEHFSMKRTDSINNGRWIQSFTAIQPEPFGPITGHSIIQIHEDDKIRVQFNGTLVDHPNERQFHLVASKFA